MAESGRDVAIDLLQFVGDGEKRPAWSTSTEDLNVNLVVLDAGSGVDEHLNEAVDVLIVGIQGEGTLEIDGRIQTVEASQLVVIPKGSRRALCAGNEGFAYLSCHRRRPALRPSGLPGQRGAD